MTVSNLNYKNNSEETQGGTQKSGGIKDPSHDEIKVLLEENNKMLATILKNSQKMNRFIIGQQIFSLLKILIFAIPIVLGILYLPPLIEELMVPYRELMGLTENANNLNMQLDSIDPNILNKFLK